MWENVFLLILTAAVKIALTAWTFGMMVYSALRWFQINTLEIFPDSCRHISSNHSHWCMSRPCGGSPNVRILLAFFVLNSQFSYRQGLYRAYPSAWVFASCPPDPSVRCISPGFYAVIGASAMLGGVTRMTSMYLVDDSAN
jgi:chloride channel 3/4/5